MNTTGTSPIFGPGSQPADPEGVKLDYMEMPKGMATYHMPEMPEPEDISGLEAALGLLAQMKDALKDYAIGDPARIFDLTGLDAANRAFVDQLLGEGEVSAVGGERYQVQESVLTGVWRVHVTDETGALQRDLVEIAGFPQALLDMALDGVSTAPKPVVDPLPGGVVNAPALLTELADAITAFAPEASPHVINLSLLPLTEEDVMYLDDRVGKGRVTILSRGYGNCRITSTGTANVWWVQYFNSRDALILNTMEVARVPDVACAAQEDIDDSAERLGEILGVYR